MPLICAGLGMPDQVVWLLPQVSKYRSMNVSTMTDARVHSNYVIQTGEVPVRHSHEEYMDVSAPAQLCWPLCLRQAGRSPCFTVTHLLKEALGSER